MNGQNFSLAFDTGVWGVDLLAFEAFDLLFILPPLADTGVWKGLLDMLVTPGLLVHWLDSTSLLSTVLFFFNCWEKPAVFQSGANGRKNYKFNSEIVYGYICTNIQLKK